MQLKLRIIPYIVPLAAGKFFMAVATKQIGRYRIIDECLQNKMHGPSSSDNPEHRGFWPLKDLRDAITEKLDLVTPVSYRTLKEDLKRMRDDPDLAYYAPIANKKGIGYYYVEDFKLTEKPLSPAEVLALKDVVELLKQFKGFRYFEGAEGIIHQIESRVSRAEFPEVQFDVLPDYRGYQFIDDIKKAIREKKVLKMVYRAFYEEAELPRHIHPYLLKEYNNRWFVYARTQEYDGEGVYGLDRILTVEPTDLAYRPPDRKKIINYFKDIIGVTNYEDREVEHIVLKVGRERANYLSTKPVHASQKIIKESRDHVWFSFRLKPNNELTALILSHGKDMVVEKPASLAVEIRELLQSAEKNYS